MISLVSLVSSAHDLKYLEVSNEFTVFSPKDQVLHEPEQKWTEVNRSEQASSFNFVKFLEVKFLNCLYELWRTDAIREAMTQLADRRFR